MFYGYVKGDEVSLQRALNMVQKNSYDYVAVLFYASWCPFSRTFRPTFSALSSLYPSIPHFAIEESAVRPRFADTIHARITFHNVLYVLAKLFVFLWLLVIALLNIFCSILSKYGVHGFPTLFILNSTMRVRYHGSRTPASLVAFYGDVTGKA